MRPGWEEGVLAPVTDWGRKAIDEISNTMADIHEQAIDRLICEGIEFERMCLWYNDKGSCGIMIDREIVFHVEQHYRELDGKHEVVITQRWQGSFKYLGTGRREAAAILPASSASTSPQR